MSEKAEKLKAELASLSLEDRHGIREYLESLEDEELAPEDWQAAWSEEINRRLEDMKSGKTKPIPWEEVSRKMREKYG
jgi:putative addiction module component (TIGR02574 family)